MITKIRIKRFRSINDLEIFCGRITTFLGENDVGKSNIVRAMNLFFNSETDIGTHFDFDQDFNRNAPERRNKSDEIEITLTFEIPDSYKKSKNFGTTVEWKKIWRKTGYQSDKDQIRYTKHKSEKISDRGRLKAFLERHYLLYAPAIKDKEFFSVLLGKIYDQLSESSKNVTGSSRSFNRALTKSTKGLAQGLKKALGGVFTVSLPENLKPIFANLDIRNKNIPFSSRGDGIKVRHIPEIFKFLSELIDRPAGKGMVRPSHIWIFEEPENNLEVLAAYELVQRIFSILEESKNLQIFITTHSPVFYKIPLPQEIGTVERYLIGLEKKFTVGEVLDENRVVPELEVLDSGANAYLDIKKTKDAISSMMRKNRISKQIDFSQPTIFVEGESDRLVFSKTLELFFKEKLDDIVIKCFKSGGLTQVHRAVKMWQANEKLFHTGIRSFAIVDQDRDDSDLGNGETVHGDDIVEKSNTVQIHKIGYSKEGLKILKRGFKVRRDLESLYPNELWRTANEKKWLEEVTVDQLYSSLTNEFRKKPSGEMNFEKELEAFTPGERLKITHKFIGERGKNRKLAVAREICTMNDDDAKLMLKECEVILKSAVDFLVPK